MTSLVPGVAGILLPERYISSRLLDDVPRLAGEAVLAIRLQRWWRHAAERCGPTSPLRQLFDDMAMPLFALLGFTAHDAAFEGHTCRARLVTPRRAAVALILAPWASRPSARWADLSRHAERIDAGWGFVLAPPFLSVLPTRGYATRRSVEITLPLAVSSSVHHLLALIHASRFDAPAPRGADPSLNAAVAKAAAFQDDVRMDLQHGVERSIRHLMPVVADPSRLRAAPGSARVKGTTPADQALTIVYRILFLLFAESRHLLPRDEPVYRDAYAMSQLCRHAVEGASVGLWDGLAAASRLSRFGCNTDDLHVTPFNGALFSRAAAPALERRRRAGRDGVTAAGRDVAMRETLVALGSRQTRGGRETINYRDLGVEQLGAVYERILDFAPASTAARETTGRVSRQNRHSHLRRQTGTFYTPQPLAEFVVRRTLAPLVEDVPADRILDLRVVDPAMGSGAFLVAACRYLASAYEGALVAEQRLSPEDIDDRERARMRRLIAERCLCGVDRNGTAVQLARLSLWLTTLAEGRPLGFLDHRLRVGDTLIGAWPDDLRRSDMRARGRGRPMPLLDAVGLDHDVREAAGPIRAMLARPDAAVSDVHAKEAAWRRFQSPACALHRWRMAAHIWCARWFAERTADAPGAAETRALIDAVLRADRTLGEAHVERRIREASAIAARHGFFHWPFEYPDVFESTDPGAPRAPGFDAVVGNPPWEMVRRDEGEPRQRANELVAFVRQSGQYPSCRDGHLNLYQPFVDRAVSLVRPGGRVGLVLPWSIATDDGAAALRERLLMSTAVDFVAGIDNAEGLFPIHRGLRFAVISTTVGARTQRVHSVTGIRTGDQLDALPARGDGGPSSVTLTPDLIARVGGAARRLPDLRRAGDLEILRSLNERFPRLGSTDGWGVSFGRELNATDAGPHLRDGTRAGVRVVEGKHLSPFTVDMAAARRISRSALASMIAPARIAHARLAYRDVSGVGNRFALIAAVIPAGVVTTHTVFCLRSRIDSTRQHFLSAMFNSFVLNAIVRMLMGGHVTTTLAASLPTPVWRGHQIDRRIAAAARRLSRGHGASDVGARLQALVARRFELTRAEFAHVVGGFPLVPADERAAALGWFDRIRT